MKTMMLTVVLTCLANSALAGRNSTQRNDSLSQTTNFSLGIAAGLGADSRALEIQWSASEKNLKAPKALPACVQMRQAAALERSQELFLGFYSSRHDCFRRSQVFNCKDFDWQRGTGYCTGYSCK